MRATRTMLIAALALLISGCATAGRPKMMAAVPVCPAGDPFADTSGLPVFVVSTAASDCVNGTLTLTTGRAAMPAFGTAVHADKGWRVALGDEMRWLAAVASADPGRPPRVLLYVHGFNNDPDLAFDRAQRIAQNAHFRGGVAALVWPSRRSALDYAADEATNEWARIYAADVLAKLARAGVDIVLVAHSMGNRIAIDALGRLGERQPELAARVRVVVLASPDIDGGVFDRDAASQIAASGRTVTIYASSRDSALALSSRGHAFRRAGDLACKYAHVPGPIARDQRCYPRIGGAGGIALVDTSAVRASSYGHSDFIASPAGSADLCRVISGLPARGRTAVMGQPGVFVLGADAATRDDCPDDAPPPPPKRRR